MTNSAAKDEKKLVTTAILEQIQEMIRSGVLQPGKRLPPERKLAESLRVSRNSLRQAFQVLAMRGIIESRQGDGTYLLTGMEGLDGQEALLDAINEQRHFLQDIIEFRQIVEPEIAALAARRITPEALNRLKILVCDQQRAVLSGREDGCFDGAFHRQLAESAKNRVIGQVMAVLQSIVDASRSVWLQSGKRQRASMEGHLRIIDALEAGDADAARLAMRAHIAEVGHHIFDAAAVSPTEGSGGAEHLS